MYPNVVSNDIGLDTMDSCSKSFDDAIIPYSGNCNGEAESKESSAWTLPLNNGDMVKLFVVGYGEVGIGFVVET